MESSAKHRSEPPRIAIAAGVFGVIGLVGGIVVPSILDPTTVQGPLLGIFMTGPLGVFLGGHVGVLWSARHQKQTTWTELGWLAVFGGLDLLLYEFFAGIAFVTIVPASAFLITASTAAALLTYARGARALRRALVAVSIAAPLLFVTALFPPVTVNPLRGARPLATSPPHFRFLLSSDLDTRTYVPPLAIDRFTLHLEWAAGIALSVVISVILQSAIPSGVQGSRSAVPEDRS
jgi:hypothetical protein